MQATNFHAFLEASAVPMHMIEPGLWLGNINSAEDEQRLKANNIQCIVQCLQYRGIVKTFPSIEYHYVPIDDIPSADISRYIPNAIKFIHSKLNEGKGVLVHCAAGVSRSSSVVIAYYMVRNGIQFEEALELVRARRMCVCPNNGFERQLRGMNLNQLRGQMVSE